MYNKFYFIDFDGTIIKQDSLDLLFEKYAKSDWKTFDKKWEDGKIGSFENLSYAFSTFQMSTDKLDSIVNVLEIDKSFYDFLVYINSANYGYMIISEGIDYVIKKTLLNNAPAMLDLSLITRLKVAANHFNGNEIILANNSKNCIHLNECKKCSNCKSLITKNIQAKQKIYIGDGLSDRFGISNCDVVYAKNKLENYCKTRSILYKKITEFSELIC